MAEILLDKNELTEALPYFQKAYDLGCNEDWWTNTSIARCYFQIGDYLKSLKYIKIALSLKSECNILWQYAYYLSAQGKDNEAINFLDSICLITACEPTCDMMRFYVYTNLKEFEKAEKFYDEAVKYGFKTPQDYDIYIGYLYKETGRKSKAASILNNLIRRYENLLKGNTTGWFYNMLTLQLAAAYALLDDNKKALQYLSELDKTGFSVWPIRIMPGFDNLRSDPEFKAIDKRIEDQRTALRAKVREMEQRGEINF
jgi:tetratricopeptide (TPR) repeat protein